MRLKRRRRYIPKKKKWELPEELTSEQLMAATDLEEEIQSLTKIIDYLHKYRDSHNEFVGSKRSKDTQVEIIENVPIFAIISAIPLLEEGLRGLKKNHIFKNYVVPKG